MASTKQTPTTEQFTAFQKQFEHFNRVLFGGKLPSVLLNFSRKANTYGFFVPDVWKNADGTFKSEISLNPAYLAERPPESTSSTIVHEMVHLWQHVAGTPSRRGYHNEQWAAKMREVGLMPSTTGKPGGEWVGYAVTHYIIKDGKFEKAFEAMPKANIFPWQSREPTSRAAKLKKAARNKVKFTCPTCDANAWGKPGLHIICGDDESTFVAVQATGPKPTQKVVKAPWSAPGFARHGVAATRAPRPHRPPSIRASTTSAAARAPVERTNHRHRYAGARGRSLARAADGRGPHSRGR